MFQYWPDGLAQSRAWNYQLYRLIAEAQFGGGDFGEIHRAAKRIRIGNVEDWHREWHDAAERAEHLGRSALTAGRTETAWPHLLRAFSYYRSCEFFLPSGDSRRIGAYERAIGCFRDASRLFDAPAEEIRIPYEGTELWGYLFPPEKDVTLPWPTVFFLGGADALPEENYFRGVRFITRRGAACVCVNCPGQGRALRLQGLHARYDYEKPVGAVLDYLCDRPDVDSQRIGMLAESMGGYYGPRAAAFDDRIRALVVCGALYNVLTDLYDFYPPIQAQLRWVVGCPDDESARRALGQFNLEACIDRLHRPLLVVHGEEDQLVPVASARKLYEGARGVKQLRIYRAEEGGAMHGQMDDRSRNIPFMVDTLLQWLSLPV